MGVVPDRGISPFEKNVCSSTSLSEFMRDLERNIAGWDGLSNAFVRRARWMWIGIRLYSYLDRPHEAGELPNLQDDTLSLG